MAKATEKLNRGSEWRKWDLHVHTPASYDWDSKCKKTNSDIVDLAVKEGISAIAVTDHHTTESVDEIKKLGESKGLCVIPGVELRTDKGNDKIHIIALFDPSVSGQSIYDNVLCPLGFSKDDVKKATNEQVYCGFEDACKKIHEQGGLVFLHAGNKSNGIEQLDSDLKALLKTDLAFSVDIFEINSEKNADDYHNIVFPKIKKQIPCVITSDSVDRSKLTYGGHSTEVIGRASTWIKADLSFNGLKQIISEPRDRVCLNIEPPKIIDVRNNPTKYIDSVAIAPTSTHSPSWFDDSIPLSNELVAVIGKKGSGKSALVDVVALCGKSHVPTDNYSFLKPAKFRKSSGTAKKYEANITWYDKSKISMNLVDSVDVATEPERVTYLPQSFVEKICNEDGVSPLFQNEINKVIFSYVPQANRFGTTSLAQLIEKRTSSVDEAVQRNREEIDTKNHSIVALEEKRTDEYKRKIEKELAEKENEYKNIKDPAVVKEPKGKLPEADQDKLQKIEEKITDTDDQISKSKDRQIAVNNELAFIDKLVAKLDALEDNKKKIITEISSEAKTYGFDLSKIIKLSIELNGINTKKKALTSEQEELETKLNENGTDPKKSLFAKKKELETSKEAITKSFDESNKKYQQYLSQKKAAENRRKTLMGVKGDSSLKTITSLKEELEYLSGKIGTDLEKLYGKRKTLLKELYKAISNKITLYKEIYKPLIDFIEREKTEQEKSGNTLTFDAGIVFNKSAFSDSFLTFINHTKDGTFQLKDGGSKQLKDIFGKYNLQDEKSVADFADDIVHSLHFDITKSPEKPNEVKKQLNQKYTPTDIYNFIFNLEYLDVQFKILFNGKDLNENEFSPGEKGALLLIFYLLIDKEKVPLIMDQPEENLDNESVYSLLVPYIKKAKQKRQVIIVTHNPNLAVVCDAEQIIYAHMDKKNNEIRYESGSIESIEMNKRIVDVLEGTMPAFTKRDEKYLRN
ncbi:TPA: hypothetical protein DEW47_03140 [Patescibacteria group bacterium]|nr:MAG: hypothetical protein UT83_C0001G0087 [Parcubacteria group bacterium GW2011_GWA2_40_143]KKR60524.1 MAG: hypothetical protein UT97_C0001G0095 [Parcubacteria group bacterium GW2011_GWC2_40_31]KKR75628.1 MAG: hypothetical protein UU18_C0001G0025 [Parcubacteria group bacterium GW2011_GWB2_40_8]HBB56782.1 hypothetical protein [Patescibacteria group bacterium]HCI04947.1 hypothetical protein [Patescibacteria group bacterium]